MPVFRGTLVDTPTPTILRIRTDHIIASNNGTITHIAPASSPSSAPYLPTATSLPPYSFLLPTFTDLHLHAPQYLNAGMGLDLPLLSWLEKYTYAAEERVDSDPELAGRLYKRLVERLIEAGTGCALVFGTINVEANLILARAFSDAGIRGFIGKLSMDESPRPTYSETTESALTSLRTFLDAMEEFTLVKPVITPRFVPVCSDVLLRSLAKIAKERGLMLQSHMCESTDQMEWVRSLRGREDQDVFDEAGALEGSVQAHVTGLTRDMVKLVKERRVTIAHCPLSNVYFSDKAFPLREALDAGCKLGLGSDIAGGYALPIQTAMREAVVVSRMREGARREQVNDQNHPDDTLSVDWVETLYLATRGGASALGLGGVFDVGMPFDAQQLTLASNGSGVGQLDFFDLPSAPDASWWPEAIERWWCLGDGRNRTGMWVAGNPVM